MHIHAVVLALTQFTVLVVRTLVCVILTAAGASDIDELLHTGRRASATRSIALAPSSVWTRSKVF